MDRAHSGHELQGQLAERIRQARDRCGLTQQELAIRAGLPAPQTVSAIETGARSVKVVELVRIAEALHVSVSELLVSLPARPFVLWRKPPQDGAERLETEARLLERCRAYRLAEEWAGVAKPPSLPRAPAPQKSDDYAYVETLADKLRWSLGLGSYPAPSLVVVLEERAGIKVLYERNLQGSAACLVDEGCMVILVNASDVPWRRHFSVAHELFHLLTWDSMPPDSLVEQPGAWNQAEKLANAFAAALLLPEDSLLEKLGGRQRQGDLQPADWVELALEFGVSTDALLWRLVSLGQLERSQAQALVGSGQLPRLEQTTLGHYEEPGLLPDRFRRLLLTAYVKGTVSVARIAELTGQSLVDVRTRLAQLSEEEGEYGQAEYGQAESASA